MDAGNERKTYKNTRQNGFLFDVKGHVSGMEWEKENGKVVASGRQKEKRRILLKMMKCGNKFLLRDFNQGLQSDHSSDVGKKEKNKILKRMPLPKTSC